MKRRILLLLGTVLALSLAASVLVTVATAAPHSGKAKSWGPPAKITWSQKLISETVAAGDTVTVSVTFTSTKDIAEPVLSVRPKKADFVEVSGFPTTIVAGTPYTVDVQISIPADTTRASFNAMIFVKDRHTLAWPLPVRAKVSLPETPEP